MARNIGGTPNYLDIGTASELEIAADITVFAWGLLNTNTNQVIVGAYQGSSPFTGWGFAANIGGAVAYWSNALGAWKHSTQGLVQDGLWHALGVSISGATGTFYYDGAASGTFAQSAPGLYTGSKAIGKAMDGTNYFHSSLAEIAVWATALNASEMAALHNGTPPYEIRPGQLVGYWPLWGVQSPEPDLSGNGNSGTLHGPTAANHAPLTVFLPDFPASPFGATAVNATVAAGQNSASWTDGTASYSGSAGYSPGQQSSTWSAPVPTESESSLWTAAQQSATWTDAPIAVSGGASVVFLQQQGTWTAPGEVTSGSDLTSAGADSATWTAPVPAYSGGAAVALGQQSSSWTAPAPGDTGSGQYMPAAPGGDWSAPSPQINLLKLVPAGSGSSSWTARPAALAISTEFPAGSQAPAWSAPAPVFHEDLSWSPGPNSADWTARIPEYRPEDCSCPYTVINFIIKL